MKWIAWLGMALLAAGCGGSDSGAPRTAAGVCQELCNVPDECYGQLGVTAPDMNCVEACESQIDLVGLECLDAILDTFECIGTCDFNQLTEDQIRRCEDEALAISGACE